MEIRTIVESTLVPHSAFSEAVRRLEQCFSYAHGASEPICIAVVGESRTGKSRALEECFAKRPAVREAEGLRIPILRVKTPSKPTVKGLAELMLSAMGDPCSDKGTENSKTIRLKTLLRNCGTHLIMIDEFQHFVDKGSRQIMHHVADWLKIVVDDSRVALVVAGLPSCHAVLEQNEQLSGRFSSPVLMPRFDWNVHDHREEFIAILGAFYESLSCHFSLPDLDNEELAFRCYCATGGLIGYLSKFLRHAVWNTLDAGQTSIGLVDLMRAHDESVWARSGPLGIPSPFSRDFVCSPTRELIAKVQRLGTPVEVVPPPRRCAARGSKAPRIREVLSAS